MVTRRDVDDAPGRTWVPPTITILDSPDFTDAGQGAQTDGLGPTNGS